MSTCLIIWLTILTLGLVKHSTTLKTSIIDDATVVETGDPRTENVHFKDDLTDAESKVPPPSNLEIIKQIRKLNQDGSYTVGYEADDGTFKIESRDVLGNVRGTYGYVDVNGEIKRVSYTTNNSTSGLRSTARPTVQTKNDEDKVVQIPRQNKSSTFISSTTRRPQSLAYLTTSMVTPTRSSVVQTIPMKRILLTASSERPTYNHYHLPRHGEFSSIPSVTRKNGDPTTTLVYATSLPSNQSIMTLRPTSAPASTKTVEQIARPEKLEITDHVSRVKVSSNRDSSKYKPVTEEVNEKKHVEENTRTNFVRRQLASDEHDEHFEAQQQVIYSQSAGDDSSHIFGGVTGTARPLFTTTSPRIPSVVLAARSRAALLQNVINGNAQKLGSEKVFVRPAQNRVEEKVLNEQSTEPSSENQFYTKRPGSSAQPIAEADTIDDARVFRRPVTLPPSHLTQPVQKQPQHGHREFVRQAPPSDFDYGGPRQFRIPIPQAYPRQPPSHSQPAGFPRGGFAERPTDEIDQTYIRETTTIDPKGGRDSDPIGGYEEFRGQRNRGGRMFMPPPSQQQYLYQKQQSLLVPFAQNPYNPYIRNPVPLQHYKNSDRPLTARDFERLLNLLVVRHQHLQQYGGYSQINPYLLGGGGSAVGDNFIGYGAPNHFGYQQIPRPPLYNPYDPRYIGYNRIPYGEYSEQDNVYRSQGQADTASGDGNVQDDDPQAAYDNRRLVHRRPSQQQYQRGGNVGPNAYYSDGSEYSIASQPQQQGAEYLPGDIREELLYRMLLLAMQPSDDSQQRLSEQQSASSPEYAASPSKVPTTTTSPVAVKPVTKLRKPVRSVQILGEE